ncbi:hypothetical protein ACGLHS_01155 [Variovorax sp. VaC1]|uniref:hypothetical protein n=1 Tax=Variovorax sp. VaC1 TaxID=3373132 RepID=UPI00374A0DF2
MNNPGLNSALTGVARKITITNTGLYDAKGLKTASSTLPLATSISSNCNGVLPAGSSCQVMVTPGATPTTAPLAMAPTPVKLLVSGDNTNTSSIDIHILSYGSVYQAGYVFALDDTTVSTTSVGGKTLALSPASNGEIWGPDGPTTGIPYGEGRATTRAVADLFQGQPSAAKTCISSSAGGYSDWYLPGWCELWGRCGSNTQSLLNTLFNIYPGIRDWPRSYWVADPQSQWDASSTTTAVSYDFQDQTTNVINPRSPRNQLKTTRCMRDLSS